MPLMIVRQDITKMNVDAIVNAANTQLQMGGGVCGAIFKAAGAEMLQKACNKAAPIRTGEAVITKGFELPAKYVIHAAGPIYSQWHLDQARNLLYSAYRESLKVAVAYRCKSIAFPLISSGIYGYPKAEALQVASMAIQDFLNDHEMDVYLVVFDKSAFIISERLMGEVESYIDEHYVAAHSSPRRALLPEESEMLANAPMPLADAPVSSGASTLRAAPMPASTPPVDASAPSSARMPAHVPEDALPSAAAPSLDELVEYLDEPFSDTLLKLIDAKGKTDVEVYKKANIDRKLFSKIRSHKGYTPKKPTILALAIALELSLAETDDLLERAGYALSHASKFDVIVEYFIIKQKYNIYDINEVLFKYDQPLLGA